MTDYREAYSKALDYLLNRLGYGAETTVALESGVSQSQINKIRKGVQGGRPETLEAIAKAFKTDYPEMLILGRRLLDGAHPEAHPEPVLKIIVSNQLDKQILDDTAQDYRGIPLYESGKLAAGINGLYFNDNEIPESEVIVYRPELKHRDRHNLCAVRVGGDSMEPMIPEGSIVVIDLDDKEFFDRKVFCVKKPDDGEWMAAVKRVRKWERGFVLVSENPEYSPEPVEVEWRDLCVGRVIWMWRSIEEV